MNVIKFVLAATVMAGSVTATAQIVYTPDFPSEKAPVVETVAVDNTKTTQEA